MATRRSVKSLGPLAVRKSGRALQAVTAEAREMAFAEVICAIPRGKVATYGQVAAEAGYPRHHRAVARFLSTMYPCDIPWQRVVGAGGEIKVGGTGAALQRRLLKEEGVTFSGKRIAMARHAHFFED